MKLLDGRPWKILSIFDNEKLFPFGQKISTARKRSKPPIQIVSYVSFSRVRRPKLQALLAILESELDPEAQRHISRVSRLRIGHIPLRHECVVTWNLCSRPEMDRRLRFKH